VDDAHLTVQDALSLLQLEAESDARLVRSMLSHAVVRKAIADEFIEATPGEIQHAADAIRASLGLHSAEATRVWLRRNGWSGQQFSALVAGGVQARKLKKRLTEGRLDDYFEAHRSRFDTVRVVRVTVKKEPVARVLREAAGQMGLLAAVGARDLEAPHVKGVVDTVRAGDLPPECLAAVPGTVSGPIAAGNNYVLVEVLDRREAQWNDETRDAVRDAVFQEWLDTQLEHARIQWHWM
jgi:putative peptide maturation system protein